MVEHGMKQGRSDPSMFRMVVDGQEELIMAVRADDMTIAGSDETCRDFRTALGKKSPSNILGEVTLYPDCASKRYWVLDASQVMQQAFIESMLNHFVVTIYTVTPPPSPVWAEGEKRRAHLVEPGLTGRLCAAFSRRRQSRGRTSRTVCVLWRATPTTLRRGTGRQF